MQHCSWVPCSCPANQSIQSKGHGPALSFSRFLDMFDGTPWTSPTTSLFKDINPRSIVLKPESLISSVYCLKKTNSREGKHQPPTSRNLARSFQTPCLEEIHMAGHGHEPFRFVNNTETVGFMFGTRRTPVFLLYLPTRYSSIQPHRWMERSNSGDKELACSPCGLAQTNSPASPCRHA